MLTPAFHYDIMRTFMSVYDNSAIIMFGLWDETMHRDRYIILQDFLPNLTLDVLLQCIGSLKTNCQVEKQNLQYIRDVSEITRIIWLRSVNVLNFLDIYFYNTHNGKVFKKACERSKSFILDLILKCKRELQNNNSEGKYLHSRDSKNFLNILLTTTDENGKGLTDEEICDEVNTFIFGGHDTTAVAMEWVLYFLAKFPNYQEKCRKEVLEWVKEDEIRLDNLSRLEFLNMFIKESMRIRPPVHMVARETQAPETFEGFLLPTGTMVQISILNLHWNPDLWPEPFKFDPYRFSPENIDKITPYSYLPFAVGERNCIGQNFAMHEIKTVISMVLRNYKFSLHPSIIDTDVKIKKDVILKPLTPIKLILKRFKYKLY